MLFSELNRINLSVLIEDPKYEYVPDISADCYVHNKGIWKKFVKEIYNEIDDDLVVKIPNEQNIIEPEDLGDGWNTISLYDDDLQNTYLLRLFGDISENLIEKTDLKSDIVNIYAGQFDADGTFDYESLVDDNDFQTRNQNMILPPHPPIGSWWTFNNGAFQWIGGPKSIFECRYSYGPFNALPFCGSDPHHFDNNHKMLDNINYLSFLPNLIFVFDELHILKGIVSLPCGNSNLIIKTKKFIEDFTNYATSNYQLSFKNIDKILKEYSCTQNIYIPTIKILHKHPIHKVEKKPVVAIFDIIEKTQEIEYDTDHFKYILPNKDNMSIFLENSKWKSYKIDLSLNIPKVPSIPSGYEPLPPLKPEDTLATVEDHVNKLQGAVQEIYGEISRYNLITSLSERYICKPLEGKRSTAMLTISDIFKYAKEIRKIKENTEYDLRIIVLPEKFCNKETLSFITNVRYPGNDYDKKNCTNK